MPIKRLYVNDKLTKIYKHILFSVYLYHIQMYDPKLINKHNYNLNIHVIYL